MMSRTNMKLAVMREHSQFLEAREKQQLASSAPTSSAAIQVPLQVLVNPEPIQVPKQILKVQTRLENPTRFHLQERQKRQVRQFLNDNTQSSDFSPPSGGAGEGVSLAAQAKTSPAIVFCNVSSNSPHSVPHSSTATSPNELDEFWDDFHSLGVNMESDVNLLEPTLALPNTMPATNTTALHDLYPLSEHNTTTTSASCPALSETSDSVGEFDFKALVKDRQKKDNHNMIERRRRFNINDRIKELGTLLPRNNDQFSDVIREQRQNKGTILRASVEYLKVMKREISKIPHLEEKQRQLEMENKKLLLRIKNLENQLQNNGITVPEATWQPLNEHELTCLVKHEPLQLRLTSSCLSSGVHCGSNSCSSSTIGLLKIKQEICTSPSHSISSGLSSAPSASPAPPLSHYEDFMMDDETPVNGDPMLSSHHLTDDALSPDNMDFLA